MPIAAIMFGAAAQAQTDVYPARPITLVVPFPAGGGVDAMARMIGQKLSVAIKQQVVIENRGGGNGNVGTQAVAKATSGRLHAAARLYRHARHQPEPEQERGLFAANRFRARSA